MHYYVRMPRTTHRSFRAFLIATSLAGGAVAVFACSDETPPPGSATPDAATSPDLDGSSTTNPDTSTAPTDSGPVDEVDGGGVPIEDDGGTTDLDGGFDAGPACGTVGYGAFNPTSCLSGLTLGFQGGTLTTTTYELQKVNPFGSKAFCAPGGGYVEYQHRGGLIVTVTGGNTATFEFLDQYRKTPSPGGPINIRPTTNRYDVDVAVSTSTLTFTPKACALKPAPAKATFQVGQTAGGKKTITMRLPYGTSGTANYYFVEP
jgi:hypothetical protein